MSLTFLPVRALVNMVTDVYPQIIDSVAAGGADVHAFDFSLKFTLSFPKRGKLQVDLQDGRSIVMPVSAFPSLKRVPVSERSKWYLMGGGVTWDACPEVIHIEQILGNYQNYAHEVAR